MVVPNNHGFPPKNDHFGVFWGYHHLRKHPFFHQNNHFRVRRVQFLEVFPCHLATCFQCNVSCTRFPKKSYPRTTHTSTHLRQMTAKVMVSAVNPKARSEDSSFGKKKRRGGKAPMCLEFRERDFSDG